MSTTKSYRLPIYGLLEKRTSTSTSPDPKWTVQQEVDTSAACTHTKGDGIDGWKRKIRECKPATSTLEGTRQSCRSGIGGYASVTYRPVANNLWNRIEFRGSLSITSVVPADPSSILITSVKNAVIQKVLRQVRKGQTSLQGLVTAGEMGETLRMMRNRSQSFHNALLNNYLGGLRRLSPRSIGRLFRSGAMTRFLSDTWLEFQFGWKPLLSDVEAGAKALAHTLNYQSPRIRLFAEASSSEKGSVTKNSIGLGHSTLVARRQTVSEYSCKIYGALHLDVDEKPVIAIQQFGLNPLTEFLPTLWELLPYSFLVDYFTNVGGIIEAYSTNTLLIGWLNMGELKSSVVVTSSEFIVNYQQGYVYSDYQYVPDSGFERRRDFYQRTQFPIGNLVPQFEFKIPGLGMKWLNIAALFGAGSRTSRHLVTMKGR
jgi:hypothetical protein